MVLDHRSRAEEAVHGRGNKLQAIIAATHFLIDQVIDRHARVRRAHAQHTRMEQRQQTRDGYLRTYVDNVQYNMHCR